VGIAHAALEFLEPKLLVAQPKQGEQVVHFDATLAYDAPPTTITFLMHPTEADGNHSTAVPLFSSRAHFPRRTDTSNTVIYGSPAAIPTRMRRKQLQDGLDLLQPACFHRVPVRVGDVALCRQTVPHFDTRNDSSGQERVVLFGMLAAPSSDAQDD